MSAYSQKRTFQPLRIASNKAHNRSDGSGLAMKSIAAASVLVGSLLVVGCAGGVRTDSTGRCPTFDAAQIDKCFSAWQAATAFDPAVDYISCLENSDKKIAGLQFTTDEFRANWFDFTIMKMPLQPPKNTMAVASVKVGSDYMRAPGCAAVSELNDAQNQICRAEILRSVVWRQNCREGDESKAFHHITKSFVHSVDVYESHGFTPSTPDQTPEQSPD